MKMVIGGGGVVGMQVARQLIAEHHDVVLIESDADQARYAGERLDCMVVNGAINNLAVLREAGLAGAEYFIAVTGSDEINMISCALVDRNFTVPYKVARIRSFEYSDSMSQHEGFMGVDWIVTPETETALAVIRSIEHGATSDVMVFEHTDVQIRSFTVEPGSELAGRALKDTGSLISTAFLIVVVLRDNAYIIPSGDTQIRQGDVLYVVTTSRGFDQLFDALGKHRKALNRIVMVGGGRIATQVLTYLYGANHTLGARSRGLSSQTRREPDVKVIERDTEKCRHLANRFPKAVVVNADIADDELFEEERLGLADVVVATTENQELNMVTAVYAKSRGIPRSIVLVGKANYIKIASNLGIDASVSLKTATVDSVLRFIRGRSNVSTVYSIFDGAVEVIELPVHPESKAAGARIQELPLPKNSLVVALVRMGEHLVPRGDRVIHAEDQVIAIATSAEIDRVQRLFTG